MRGAIVALLVGILSLIPPPLEGQVAWESPILVSPGSPSGWGVFLTDPSNGRGVGALATWSGGGPIGFRAGLAEGYEQVLAVYGGVDVSGTLVRASSEFPFDVDWLTGAGMAVGEAARISFPFGVSIGRDVSAEGVWFNPYVAPRLVLDAWMGSSRPRRRQSLRLEFPVDLGLDLAFSQAWAIRFGATVASRNALAIGVSFQP